MLRTLIAATLCCVAIAAPRAAEPLVAGDLMVERPWARASIGTSRPGAVYLTIRNDGTEPDALVAVSTEAAETAEVHETVTEEGVTRMKPAGEVGVPPEQSISLAPGGKHIMLMGLREPLVEGDNFPLVLTFKNAGEVPVSVPVLGIGSRGPEE